MSFANGGPGDVSLGEGDRAAAVAAVKAVLRVSVDAEDAFVAGLAEAALGVAERFTGQVLIARDMIERVARLDGWQALEARPVLSIASGADVAAVDVLENGTGWVRTAGGSGPASVTVTAGLAEDWDGLPSGVRMGVAMLAAFLFDQRDTSGAMPSAVSALWRPWRVHRLDAERRA